jgi:large subunit ribosomal protein L31e
VRLFTINLSRAYDKTRQRRAPIAVRLVKKFLATHLKTDDIRIGRHLNGKIWEKSIQHPPRKIKVNVFKLDKGYGAELEGFVYEEFKAQSAKKPEGLAEKLTARLGGKAEKNLEEERLAEGKKEEKKE